jgi:flagellar motor switch protein FliN
MNDTFMHILHNLIREISPELKQLDTVPLTGAPPFEWNLLGQKLAKIFNKTSIDLTPTTVEWRTNLNLLDEFKGQLSTLSFSAPSLKGTFYWVMCEESLTQLKTLLLTDEPHPIHYDDKELDKTFLRFVAIEVLYHFSDLHSIPHFTPILQPEEPIELTNALCMDISVAINQHNTITGRLIIDQEFHHSWIDLLTKNEALRKNEALANRVDVVLHIEAAQTHLNLKQWQTVKAGDFVLLDHCALQTDNFQGRVLLTAHGHPIFHAKVKDGKIKILDFPLYQEVQTPMAKNDKNKDEENNELEDFDFEDSFDFEDTEDEETSKEKEENIDEESDEQNPKDDLDNSTEAEKEIEEPKTAQPLDPLPAIKPEQIPVSLIVELGRVQMTVDHLLKLEPGNFLDLEIHPENGVDLVINGKLVGRGELLRLGESLGIRILELG